MNFIKTHYKSAMVSILFLGIILYFFGSINTYSHFFIQEIQNEFVDYIDSEVYTETITMEKSQLPFWCFEYVEGMDDVIVVEIEKGRKAKIGLFADFQEYEQLYQSRNVITGTLKEEESTIYYRFNGEAQILPIYLDQEQPSDSFDHTLIQ